MSATFTTLFSTSGVVVATPTVLQPVIIVQGASLRSVIPLPLMNP